MLVLVIDASSAAVTAGVVDMPADVPPDPVEALAAIETVGLRRTIDARAHAELLATGARESVAEAGATMGDLAAVIAGVGPGPYTGLRVGIITAASFADALGIAVYGVCSLDGIGLGVRERRDVLVAADARRREVYWARYVDGCRSDEPKVNRPADLLELIASDRPEAMAGAGARMYAEALGLPLLEADYPQIAAMAAMAAVRLRSSAPSEVLMPMYLRRPDAAEPSGPAKSTLGR